MSRTKNETIRIEGVSARRLWSVLTPASKRFFAAGVLCLLMMVAAASLIMEKMRSTALNAGRENIDQMGAAIAEHTTTSIQAVDLVLQQNLDILQTDGILNPDQFRSQLNTKAIYRTLRQEADGLPQANAFTIIDADGKLVNFSRRWPIPPIDLSDRTYFKYLRTHDDQTPFITDPVRNRGDGTWTFYVARRVDGPSGQFLGLLLGAADLNYFDDFYRTLSAYDGIHILLLRRDGRLLASFPNTKLIGQRIIRADSPWYDIVAGKRQNVYEGQGVLEPGRRLVSVYPLRNYPLVVTVSAAESAVLANWRREAWLTGALMTAAGAMLCVILLVRALASQLRWLELSQAALAEKSEALSYLAHHDDLTSLTNRRVFRKKLEDAIELADRNHCSMAVLYLDLDRFKQVNDTWGHRAGDRLLVQVAERLHEAVRDIDTVARTGGDEFAIIQPLIGNPAIPIDLAVRVLEEIERPFEIEGVACRVGMSVGIAFYPDHAVDASALLRNADSALYRAKKKGQGSYCVFDETMDDRGRQLFTLEQELRQAVALRQFELVYQPIVDAMSRRVARCEALLRWRHPARGMVTPDDFIGLVETLGLIVPIGNWVFETACMQAASWPESVSLTVNLSPAQFKDESLTDTLTDILGRAKLRPSRLILEVTEGLLLHDTSKVLTIMDRLRTLGVRFSLDDFGTGYSGLGYLRQFPFDGIKIDKLFVQDIVDQPEARAIIAALLTVSAALDLDVTAEGVETEAQLSELRGLHCQYVQGFLTGRPQPAATLNAIFLETA